jgi:hypothetical protein
MHYAFFLERLYFCFQFCFVLFAAINGWTQQISFGGDVLVFNLPRTLRFSLWSFNECSLFLELRLAFFFALIFVQILFYICIKVYLDLWSMFLFIKRVVLKRFKWCWKEKKFHAKKVVQKGACLDCGLNFFMPCLMSFW